MTDLLSDSVHLARIARGVYPEYFKGFERIDFARNPSEILRLMADWN
jgi:hypothetical protein